MENQRVDTLHTFAPTQRKAPRGKDARRDDGVIGVTTVQGERFSLVAAPSALSKHRMLRFFPKLSG